MIAFLAGAALSVGVVGSTFLPFPALHDHLVPGAIWRFVSLVHLTFDDGPHAERTPRVLDVLARFQVRATFFCVGVNVQRLARLARRIDSEGHEVGNHGWDHTSLALISRRTIKEQLRRSQDAIGDAIGKVPTLVRPPYGRRDFRFYQESQRLGLTPMFWSRDSGDWLGLDETRVAGRVSRARSGDIVLLHDGNPRARGLLGALPTILCHHQGRLASSRPCSSS